jgi:Amt family ammonium transporter
MDFAGGVPVQVSAGATALAIGMSLGKRRSASSPSAPFVSWGAFLLWFAWSGVNAGSALSSGGLAANAFVATDAAAAAAALTWGILDTLLRKRPSPLGMVAGLLAGLAASAPAAGYVTVWGAVFTGIGASIVTYGSLIYVKKKWNADAAFDIFCIHGMGGVWGLLAAGLCASPVIHPGGVAGLFYGNPGQVAIQIKAILATLIYTFVVSAGLLVAVDRLVGLRPSSNEALS